MASTRAAALIDQVVGAMKPNELGSDSVLQQRMGIVLRHLIAAVDEIRLTEGELGTVCDFLDQIAANHEWRFLTHVFGLDTLVVETSHGGDERRTVDNVEGPLYRPNAPEVVTPALMMEPSDPSERLFLSGQVTDVETGHPLADAVIEFWQSNATGTYAEDDSGQPDWNFRRRVRVDGEGRYSIETVVPGCYEIGDASGMASGRLMTRLGRHRMRPGHVHVKVEAPGALPMTTLLYFRGDPWIDDDSIFSVRDDVTLTLDRHDDPTAMAAHGVDRPFTTGTFDFAVERASTPALQHA